MRCSDSTSCMRGQRCSRLRHRSERSFCPSFAGCGRGAVRASRVASTTGSASIYLSQIAVPPDGAASSRLQPGWGASRHTIKVQTDRSWYILPLSGKKSSLPFRSIKTQLLAPSGYALTTGAAKGESEGSMYPWASSARIESVMA